MVEHCTSDQPCALINIQKVYIKKEKIFFISLQIISTPSSQQQIDVLVQSFLSSKRSFTLSFNHQYHFFLSSSCTCQVVFLNSSLLIVYLYFFEFDSDRMSVSVLVYVGLMYGAIGSTCTDISCEKEWNVILKYLFYDMH